MSKKTLDTDYEIILNTIALFPDGASIKSILSSLKIAIPLRTLQRWLAHLKETGKITMTGRGSASRYHIVATETQIPINEKTSDNAYQKIIPLSPVAEKIREEVTRPLNQRTYVGYKRTFLDSYLPNVTYYLPNKVRNHLLNLNGGPPKQQPSGTQARHIFNQLIIDLTWNSSRLEGNTYTLLETEHLLREGEASEGKAVEETQMILNHKTAIEFLVNSAEQIDVNPRTIFNLHSMLSENLLANPRSCGRLRSIAVRIGSSSYLPLEIPQLIDECFIQILDTARAINDPFEQSFFLLTHLPYLQPFEDVNKRTSRLAANIPFIKQNLSPISFIGVPEQAYISGLLGVYEFNKIELLLDVFVWAYEKSSALYSATKENVFAFDPFRLKYRSIISETILRIVLMCMDKKTAAQHIQEIARIEFPIVDQKRFVEVVETELLSLHEGNIARFRIRPAEYDEWQKSWH